MHAESAREHQSTPLATLKDPSSFAPPPRRLVHGGTLEAATSSSVPAVPTARPKPSLPPRLPPRQNSNPGANAPPPPPTYNEATQSRTSSHGELNQSALNRLGQAGVTVPGLGIGTTALPPVPPRRTAAANTPTPSLATATANDLQMIGSQSRFTNISTPTLPAAAPATGTSWADKQAALQTANMLRNDPSQVKPSDLRGAATTANNFQKRHGDQVASGWKTASGLSAKYGIADKVNNVGPSSMPPATQPFTQGAVGTVVKKAPPPLPPKKKVLAETPADPPPIPLSSKPKF